MIADYIFNTPSFQVLSFTILGDCSLPQNASLWSSLLKTGHATKSHELPWKKRDACVPVLWWLAVREDPRQTPRQQAFPGKPPARVITVAIAFPFSLLTLPSFSECLSTAGRHSLLSGHININGDQELYVPDTSLWVAETCDKADLTVSSTAGGLFALYGKPILSAFRFHVL